MRLSPLRLRLLLAIGSAIVVAVLVAIPQSSRLTRAGEALALLAAVGSLVSLFPRPRLAIAVVGGGFAAILLACLLDRAGVDESRLQRLYLDELRASEGTAYVWGGEGRLGLDCSGLIRRARMRACAAYAIRSCRPRALAAALDLWWNDASARELAAGYGGRTIALGRVFRLNAAAGLLEAGDLFVTADGTHVMVALGPSQVIQADPGRGRVCSDALPADNHWYRAPVVQVRWLPLR